jgi:3-methyl-2-oxobutanoate hydroxymethyltransferase
MSAAVPMDPQRSVTTTTFRVAKAQNRRIAMITAYDAPTARMVDQAGVDAILVGDSLGMVVLGHDSTLPVTMDDMLHHTRAVTRGASRALVVADMPFLSFQISPQEALRNAGRLVAEGGAGAVKLEGGRRMAETVRNITQAGIPVMGHVGLTPQSVNQLGGYRVQGRETADALALIDDCRALEESGAFAVVLECIPAELAELVSREISIPTIGIGAGVGCDGEIQVFHDLLGMGDFTPRHAGRYAEVGTAIREAVGAYTQDVRDRVFPAEAQSTHLDARVLAEIKAARAGSLKAASGGSSPSISGRSDQ